MEHFTGMAEFLFRAAAAGTRNWGKAQKTPGMGQGYDKEKQVRGCMSGGARAEDKRARKRFKRALMNAKGRGRPGRPRPCAPVSLAGAGWAPPRFSTCQLAAADGVGLGLKARPKSGGPGLYRLQRARCSPCRVLNYIQFP